MMKWRNKGAAMFLAAAVLTVSMPVFLFRAQAEEETVIIRTAEDLVEFGKACTSERYSEGKLVSLEADLDLTGTEFYPIPVFCGTFEGNNHTISGMTILQPGSGLGLFRYLEEGAVVQNLKVAGELRPEGSRKKIGGIAGTNKGRIQNCTFSGKGEALENLGGIVGLNEESGVIENCKNEAELTGNRKIGGIAGENRGTILTSGNEGEINTSSEGIEEDSENTNNISVDRENIHNTVIDEKVNDVGGIAGFSSGTIRQCSNFGTIGYEHTGYNIGGIAGRQNGALILCENEGNVMGRKDVGGIAGHLEPFLLIQYGEDTFDRINDQVDRISDTTDAMSQELRSTTDASVGNLDRVDEIVKEIKNITRDKKDDRRIKRDDFDEKAGRQLDLIDEVLAEMEFDVGSRSAERAAGRVQSNVSRARELLEMLGGGGSGGQGGTGGNPDGDGQTPPDDYIPDEDAVLLGLLTELQGCAQNITEDTAIMIEDGVDGVVGGVRDLEDDLDSLRVESRALLDMTRDYKDQLFDDVDELDEDLTGRLDQLYDELDLLSDNLKSGKDQLRGEKDRLDVQLDEMQDIIIEGKERAESERDKLEDDEENLFEDISDTATDLTNGMIIGCSNRGNIFSDFQGGGVAGTIGIEVGMDPEEDIETYGDESLYMNRYAQAAVRECRNEGDITVQRDYAGGIAGAARLGALVSNQNYGDVATVDGNYAGGIAGSSKSTVSGSYTMCEVSGNDYVGGIAGQGKNLKDNCAMVNVVTDGGEWRGSIAGDRDEDGTVSGNLYVENSLGAVDGITFSGEAEEISYETLLQREGLPSEFHTLTVTFLADEQVIGRVVCSYGQSLSPEAMPEIPRKPGFFEYWENMDLSDIRRNYKVNAVYLPWMTTIAASDEPMPALLAEAAFHPGAQLYAEEVDTARIPELPGYRIVKAYAYEAQDPENQEPVTAVKLHVLSKGADSVGIVKDGRVEKVDAVRDGDYLIFEADAAGELVIMKSKPVWGIVLVAGAAVIALVLVLRKKKGRAGRGE